MVDRLGHLLSKPIELLDQYSSSQDSSSLHLATFLTDENTHKKNQLTAEQHLVAIQQAEFTQRELLTYVMDKRDTIISEPIQALDLVIRQGHAVEEALIRDLHRRDDERDRLVTQPMSTDDQARLIDGISKEYTLMHGYTQDRMDQLKTAEKTIEYILPILGRILCLMIADSDAFVHR